MSDLVQQARTDWGPRLCRADGEGDVRGVYGEMRAAIPITYPRVRWTERAYGRFLIEAGKEAKRNGFRGGEAIFPFYGQRFGALALWIAERKRRPSQEQRHD